MECCCCMLYMTVGCLLTEDERMEDSKVFYRQFVLLTLERLIVSYICNGKDNKW